MTFELHLIATWFEIALAVVTAPMLIFISAPYGRHDASGWGPRFPVKLSWMVMESPAVILFTFIYSSGIHCTETVPFVLYIAWMIHYVNRTFIYAARQRGQSTKTMPLLIVFLAFLFNVLNAYVNAAQISHYGRYPSTLLSEPHFIIGISFFVFGLYINLRSDSILRQLRVKNPSAAYSIPHGFLFNYISSPNYLGEIIEWFGWAIATNSLAGFSFFIYTVANLAPRAASHHNWYKQRFSGYPRERHRLIPFMW